MKFKQAQPHTCLHRILQQGWCGSSSGIKGWDCCVMPALKSVAWRCSLDKLNPVLRTKRESSLEACHYRMSVHVRGFSSGSFIDWTFAAIAYPPDLLQEISPSTEEITTLAHCGKDTLSVWNPWEDDLLRLNMKIVFVQCSDNDMSAHFGKIEQSYSQCLWLELRGGMSQLWHVSGPPWYCVAATNGGGHIAACLLGCVSMASLRWRCNGTAVL